MKITTFFSRGMAIGLLSATGLMGCQKEAAVNQDLMNGSKATPALTVGLPPVLVGWGVLKNEIPYVDHNLDMDVTYVRYSQGFAINGVGFVCGGQLHDDFTVSGFVWDLWQYDPATLGWKEKFEFPAADPSVLALAINFVIGDNVYIIGTDRKTYRYNQPNNKWSTVASYPGTNDSALCGFAVNGLGYVGMGCAKNGNTSNDWWQYDPGANKWHAMSAFPGNSRKSAACFTVDGKGYLVGGLHVVPGTKGFGTTVWQYTPGGVGLNGSWKEMKDFPGSARYEANGAAATIGGVDVGLLVGGIPSGGYAVGDAWEYFPASDSWSQFPNIPGGGRVDPGVFVIGTNLFVASFYVDVLWWSR